MNVEVIKEVVQRAKDGVINLGTANGWNKQTNEQYKAISDLMVQGSQSSRNLGRCYNEYRFIALYEGQSYVVVHTVDSGD